MGCIVHGVTKSQTQLKDFHFHWKLGLYGGNKKKQTGISETPESNHFWKHSQQRTKVDA